jgi:outer membrane protein OmpA-like peptidoglycan-associated protein/tetratricopeptide (TPR) repeat protein
MQSNYGISSVIILFFFLLPGLVGAQQTEAFLKKGDKALQLSDVAAADKFYAAGLALQPDHVQANVQMGRLYLQQGEAGTAVPYLRKAQRLTRSQNQELTLLLAEAYHLSYHFDSARTHYQLALSQTRKKDYDRQELLQKRLEECQAGQELLGSPPIATIRNVGSPINSPFADHVPVLTDGGKMLIFTSRRGAGAGPSGKGKQKKANENIYYSLIEDGAWGDPQKFPSPINSSTHDAAIAVSADGKELYLYKDLKGGGIYVARQTPTGNWTEPVPIGKPINSPDFEPSIAVSDDGQYAFFSSDREGGMGGLDLYITYREPDGTWSEALNLGPSINTPYDEDAPFIDSKNNILYFSSRGHNSIGGYDIFRSSIKGSLWTPAENMGLPVNSPYDDIYFALTPDEKHAYFASDRPGGVGEKDIYLASFKRPSQSPAPTQPKEEEMPEPEPLYAKEGPMTAVAPSVAAEPKEEAKQPEAKEIAPPVVAPAKAPVKQKKEWLQLQVKVVDGADGKPLPATVTIFDQDFKAVMAKMEADSAHTAFALPLEVGTAAGKGKSYHLLVEKPGYFLYTDRLDFPLSAKDGEVKKQVALKKLSGGSHVILRNILFEFNKLEFKAEAKTELDLLYRLLSLNQDLKIEISGHTDNRGSVEVNQWVSDLRAKAVFGYLVEKGIEPGRMRAVGYGLSRPVASNATEEGRKRNRRTEFSGLSTRPSL